MTTKLLWEGPKIAGAIPKIKRDARQQASSDNPQQTERQVGLA